jgi:hypothetical protein
MGTKKQSKASGTLNSKNPNPYELAYKELWDKLPAWKRNAFAEDVVNKKYDWGIYGEFIKAVNERAEELYAEKA